MTPYEQYILKRKKRRSRRIIFWIIFIEVIGLSIAAQGVLDRLNAERRLRVIDRCQDRTLRLNQSTTAQR